MVFLHLLEEETWGIIGLTSMPSNAPTEAMSLQMASNSVCTWGELILDARGSLSLEGNLSPLYLLYAPFPVHGIMSL